MSINNTDKMTADELPEEILFDYSEVKPNRFVTQEEELQLVCQDEMILEHSLSFAPSILPDANKATAQEALDAVHRLTTLFSDIRLTNLEEILHDPMIELANSNLDMG